MEQTPDDEMKLHYRVYGSGKPVIILHGLFGSHENWHTISSKLSAHFQVFAIDLRNHGHSPHSSEINYEVMATDIKEFVEAHASGSVSLVGHSIGGKVAMQYALCYADLLDRLVVVDIAPKAYRPHQEPIFDALSKLDLTAFRTRQEIEAALATQIPDLAVRRFLLKSLERESKGGFRWRLNLPALRQHYPDLLGGLPVDRSCDRPALFLRGERSDYIQAEDEPLIRSLFPRAEIRTLAHAGHWVHADVPEDFVRNVQDFLRG